MKRIVRHGATVVLIVIVLLLGYKLMQEMGTTEYVSNTIEKEVEVISNPLDKQYEQRSKELEEKYRQIQSVEARIDVNEAEIARLQAEVRKDRKVLADFMTATASSE